MTRVKLYTGGGVSLSPIYIEGRTESQYVRLVADENMFITNGIVETSCVDVLLSDVDKWKDCSIPEEYILEEYIE